MRISSSLCIMYHFLLLVEDHFQTNSHFSWKLEIMVDIEPSTIMRCTFTAPARSSVTPVDAIGATGFRASPAHLRGVRCSVIVMAPEVDRRAFIRFRTKTSPPQQRCESTNPRTAFVSRALDLDQIRWGKIWVSREK